MLSEVETKRSKIEKKRRRSTAEAPKFLISSAVDTVPWRLQHFC